MSKAANCSYRPYLGRTGGLGSGARSQEGLGRSPAWRELYSLRNSDVVLRLCAASQPLTRCSFHRRQRYGARRWPSAAATRDCANAKAPRGESGELHRRDEECEATIGARLPQCSGMSLDAAGSNRAEARLDSSGAHPLRALARTRRRGRRDRVHRCDRVALPRYGSRDRDRRTPAPQGGDSLSRGDSTPVRRYRLGALWAGPVLGNVTRRSGRASCNAAARAAE